MYKYHCLNPISDVGLGELDENYVVTENPDEADAIFVRSAKMHEMEFGKKLKSGGPRRSRSEQHPAGPLRG